MSKVMYYDNILVSDLMSDDHLEHHGVLGMKWGIRRYQSYSTVPRKSGEGGKETGLAKKRTRLENKKASNTSKIAKTREELAKPRSAKDVAKQKKYEAKLRKVNSQWVTKAAERAQIKGEQVGALGEVKLRQQARYERKINQAQVRADKLNAKIADLEYKNLRIDRKLERIDTKESINKINDKRKSSLAEFDKNFKNNPNISNVDYKVTRSLINSEYDKDVKAIKQSPKRKKTEAAREAALSEFDKNFKNNPNVSKEDYEFTRKLINSEYDKKARRRR